MKKNLVKLLTLAVLIGFVAVTYVVAPVSAEEKQGEGEESKNRTSLSLSPVSKVLQLSSESEYEETLDVKNDGSEPVEIEVYAAPYSYVYSETDNAYKLGFSNENNFTQITRWITFLNTDDQWEKTIKRKIDVGETVNIKYKITTPKNIPAGGQYAVIFAHSLTGVVSENGIKTEASPGMILYGRSTEGEVDISAEISGMEIKQSVTENDSTRNNFFASAKVKNTGNIDFSATGTMKAEPIIGFGSYETPSDRGHVSVIPETELAVSDEWTESPGFGIYKVTWTVNAGSETQTIEKVVFVNPLPFIIISLILLTIIITWITIVVRKRKERRSRLSV